MAQELGNTNSILPFNQHKEEGHVGHFQCDFRLADLVCDALHALGTPTIQRWWLRSLENFSKLETIANHRPQNTHSDLIVIKLYINEGVFTDN